MRQPAIEIRFGEVGIQFDCLIVISQRRTIVFQHGRYIAAVIITVNEVRSQPDDVIQIILHDIVIHRCHFRLLHLLRAGNSSLAHAGFRFLVLQLLVAYQSTHKVRREESIIQQDTLREVVYGTRKVLHQIEIQSAHKTFSGILAVRHDIRCMGVYQREVETHLLFRQRRFHIGDTQWLGEHLRVIELVDIFMIMHHTFHITQFFIISQRIHRLELDSHVTVLHTSAIIALVTLVGFRIIRNHNLAVVLHVLVGLLTGFAVILSGIAVRIIRHILVIAAGRHTVAFVELHLHDFELVLLGSLTVANLLAAR